MLTSSVSRLRSMWSPGRSRGTKNIVAPPREPGSPLVRAMTIAKAAPSAPVMNHFRPLITHPAEVRGAVQRQRAEQRVAGCLEHRRSVTHSQTQTAELVGHVWSEDARTSCRALKIDAQLLRSIMR